MIKGLSTDLEVTPSSEKRWLSKLKWGKMGF